MDYDLTNIPAGYDRGRALSAEVLDVWMHALGTHTRGSNIARILDLGCGTGRFSEALAGFFRTEVIGIDPSAKMLDRAREKKNDQRVQYERGSAEAIPLASDSVDVIFMSMSFHHFSNRTLAARECRRVLRAGGVVFVRTGTREQIQAYPYVPFFPSTRAMIDKLLPNHAELREIFETVGLQLKASQLITQTIAPNWLAYADKLEAGGDSVLSRLSHEEFESGLAAVRNHAMDAGDKPITEPIDLFVFQC